jgi:hypothetical protein
VKPLVVCFIQLYSTRVEKEGTPTGKISVKIGGEQRQRAKLEMLQPKIDVISIAMTLRNM